MTANPDQTAPRCGSCRLTDALLIRCAKLLEKHVGASESQGISNLCPECGGVNGWSQSEGDWHEAGCEWYALLLSIRAKKP